MNCPQCGSDQMRVIYSPLPVEPETGCEDRFLCVACLEISSEDEMERGVTSVESPQHAIALMESHEDCMFDPEPDADPEVVQHQTK